MIGLQLVIVYGIVGFVLGLFPYTRPWGESMRGFLLSTIENLGAQGVAHAIPGLFTVAAHCAARTLRGPADRRVVSLDRAGPHQARLDLSGDRSADAPPPDDARVGVCDHRGVSVHARKRDRCLQRRQRLPRPHADAGIEWPRQPDHERLHGHLLTRAAPRRLRAHRRRRGDGGPSRRPLHQDQDTAAGGDDDPQRGRRRTDDHRLFAVCRHRRCVHRRRR